MIRHFLTRQFLTFIGVGVTAAFANWCTRYILSFELSYSIAVVLAYLMGISIAFLLNRRFVFPDSPRPMVAQAREFILINAAFLPVVWIAALALRHLFVYLGFASIAEGVAHAISLAVPAFATFLIYKFFTFGKPRSRGEECEDATGRAIEPLSNSLSTERAGEKK
ncbi:GtrA family protein [Pseudomonas nitroreducens]|uniref:GtrA family protein n=1 Tax=Pseudomonas nitroreducens TaxID=46680 RepID=UPI000B063797|nr:GtrA family protein [Pseudomonas nitroreducens]MCJ1880841.1 GtrA family protein [Pseudomonas nitroreducens]MCJ1895641.1 GtrA family protein [Pseudomonas nitroreducens]